MKTVLMGVAMCGALSAALSLAWSAERGARPQQDKPQGRWGELPPIPDNVEVLEDVVYGSGGGRDLRLVLFLPKDDRPIHPGVVFIHGGGWSGGSPLHFYRQATYLASKGYVGACVEYRLSGEAKFPAAIEDVKCAVRWMRANADKYRIDRNRIASAGGSAGGHLASMLGVMNKEDDLEGDGGHAEFSSKTNAVVAFNGAFDFTPLMDHMQRRSEQSGKPSPPEKFIGGSMKEFPEKFKQASPMTYVDATDAPHAFLHGTADVTVPIKQSVDMMEALQEVGVRAELYEAEGEGHGFFNAGPEYEKTLKRMEKFLNDVFEWSAP